MTCISFRWHQAYPVHCGPKLDRGSGFGVGLMSMFGGVWDEKKLVVGA